MDLENLPFNKLVGLRAENGAIFLTPRRDHLNHLDTVHAGVLFSLADTATGQCLLDRFPELSDSIAAVLRGSTVKYLKPAGLGSDIRAVGVVDEGAAEKFLAELDGRGRATIDVSVTVSQGVDKVLSGTMHWFAGRK